MNLTPQEFKSIEDTQGPVLAGKIQALMQIAGSPITSDDVTNKSNVPGTTDTDALNYLLGASGGLVSDTWDNWNVKRLAGTLPIENVIYITDAAYTDLGVIIRTNAFGNGFDKEATGHYYNANFNNIGSDYSGVEGFTGIAFGTNRQQWKAANESGFITGDVVCYNLEHWQVNNAAGLDGTAPNASGNYTILPKVEQITNGTKLGYVLVGDGVDYIFEDNYVQFRRDNNGNVINNWSLNTFQFGDNSAFSVVQLSEACYLECVNNAGTISGAQSGYISSVYLNNNTGSIYFDMSGDFQTLYVPNNVGSIQAHVNGFSSGLEAETNTGTIIYYVNDVSYMYGANNSGDLYGRIYDQSYMIHESNAGDFLYGETKNGFYGRVSLNNGKTHTKCVYANPNAFFDFDNTVSYLNKTLTTSCSDFDITVDMTGLTTIDIDTPYIGIVYLTSTNATERLSAVANPPSQGPGYTLYSTTPGTAITVVSTAVDAPPGAGSMCLENNASVVLTGRTEAILCDFLALKANGVFSRQNGSGGSIL